VKRKTTEIEPPGTYRPQYRFRWRGAVRLLNHVPWLKERLADFIRKVMGRLFERGLITTERVLEYPFIFQNLRDVNGPVMDLGSCSSRVPVALAARGFRTIALDVNPYPHRHPNLLPMRGDAMRLPFADGTVATVLAVSVIEHIGIGHYGDPKMETGDQQVVREIGRVLRAGGKALITVPFGQQMIGDFQRVYSPAWLKKLLAPLSVIRVEYAWGRHGVWMPCTEPEAASADWKSTLAVALVVATTRGESHAHSRG
jgi:SAM-dependent methyltransferase